MVRVLKEHPLETRIYHWIHLLALIALGVTGFFIRYPYLSGGYGTLRFVHFISMYVVVFNLILRVSYAFISRNRDFHELGLGWKQWRMIPGTLAYYAFIRRDPPKGVGEYNPLQRITYNLWGLMLVFQAFTGFALYRSTQPYFSWVTTVLGGLPNVRSWHTFIMWLFIATVGLHIYLSLFEEFDEFKYMILSITPEELRR